MHALPGDTSGMIRFLLSGEKTIGKSFFAAGGDAGQAADAVGVAYKIRVRYVYIHGAGLGALPAASAAGGVLANAEESQYTPQPLSGTPGAEIIAERTVDKQRGQ